jgi:hypothetical protein
VGGLVHRDAVASVSRRRAEPPIASEAAAILLDDPDFVPFRLAVLWAAERVGHIRPHDDVSALTDRLRAASGAAEGVGGMDTPLVGQEPAAGGVPNG